jgi:hypothetical protein
MFLGLGMAVVVALGAAQADKKESSGPVALRDERRVVLGDDAPGRQPIYTERGVLTEVDFPEDFLDPPECGQWCDDAKDERPEAVYRLQTELKGHYLTVQRKPVRHASTDGMVVTIIVRLEHNKALTLELIQDPAADTRVVFTYPDRKAESEYVKAEYHNMEAVAAQKVAAGVTDKFLRAFAGPHRCLDKTWRSRNDDVVLEVQQLCYFGENVVISFTVENRAREPLKLANAAVTRGLNVLVSLPQEPVQFQQTVSGVVSMQVPESANPRGPFELTIYEDGGRKRVVTVAGVGF